MVQPEAIENEDVFPSYFGRLTQSPLLSAYEEVELTGRCRMGCGVARAKLIESNMRLVINIAKSYHSKAVPIEDLIQEGAIGLMNAVERFDPTKGFRLSTYATYWIRQAIGRAIDNKSKAIRLPAHVSQTIRKIDKARAKVMHDLGREPTGDQIAAELGITGPRLQQLIQSSQEMLSLDMKVGGNDNTTLGNLIQDSSCTDAEESVLSSEVIEELHAVMSELTERERRVLSYRMRISDTDSNEVVDVLPEVLNLSREKIRQIEVQAMKKLRRLAQRHKLNDLMNP